MPDVVKYSPTWESLSKWTAPQWIADARLGIFIHWGPFSVSAYHDWYARNMYIKGSDEYKYHIENFGAHENFGYKDFIPMLTAEKFDAWEWVKIFRDSGAGYVIPVAEHHDGFQMYKSRLSKWNAYEMGPKRDVLAELKAACDDTGLVFGASSHRIEHWWFFGYGRGFASDVNDNPDSLYAPAFPEPPHQDLHSEPAPDTAFLEDWLARCVEIVDRFAPRMIYFDWWIQHAAVKPYLLKFAAYYYNSVPHAAIAYKHDGMAFGTGIVEMERGGFAEAKPFAWQTCTSVMTNSWCYSKRAQYKQSPDIIRDLVDIVSKNGTMLLNIGPKPDGTIPVRDREILSDIGKWLAVNGCAIRGARPWRLSGEGPTAAREGQFIDGAAVEYTSQDFRFTAAGGKLYAICMASSAEGKITIRSLAESSDTHHKPVFHGIIDNVRALGADNNPVWTRNENGLHVQFTPVNHNFPVVFEILLR